jgi:hypothetical protein
MCGEEWREGCIMYGEVCFGVERRNVGIVEDVREV